MQATSYRIPAGIVLVSVVLVAWVALRPFGHRPVIDGAALARSCIDGSPSTPEIAHTMGEALRRGSLLGPMGSGEPPRGGTPPSPPPPAVAEIAPCTDPLRLVATAASRVSSRAVIANGGARAELVRVGAPVGAHTLVAIGARDVVLADDAGRSCTLAMSGRAEEGPQSAPPMPVLHRPAGERPAREGVSRGVAPHRGALRSALGRVRVRPHTENGRTTGVRLTGVRTSAVLRALGFEENDVVRAVNGYPVANPDDALAAYTALRDATRLTVSLERSGAPLTIDFNVL